MRPLYISPSMPRSFSASLNSPIQQRYAYLREKAFRPKRLCGSWIVILEALLDSP